MLEQAKQSGYKLNVSCFREEVSNKDHDEIILQLKELLSSEHCSINIIIKGPESPKLSECSPMQIFGRTQLIEVPQKDRQVLKNTIREYFQTIGEKEYQAH